MNRQRTIRLEADVAEGVENLARESGRDFSAIVNELLDETLKMRRIPGIYFADTPSGRVATIAGSGLGVWEIIMGYRSVDEEWDRLRESFHWLTEHQLRVALAFFEAYPEEIEDRIQRDERWTPEKVYETYPFMRPPHKA